MLFLRLRLQYMKSELIRGWYEVPYLYLTLGLVGISVFGITYKLSRLDDAYTAYTRHKDRYIVLRPDDVRLENYPRKYITDLDTLDNYLKRVQAKQE